MNRCLFFSFSGNSYWVLVSLVDSLLVILVSANCRRFFFVIVIGQKMSMPRCELFQKHRTGLLRPGNRGDGIVIVSVLIGDGVRGQLACQEAQSVFLCR